MKPKIYYIANARMPNKRAHGIQLAKMCEAFVMQGIDLELIIPRKNNIHKESIKEFYDLTKEIKIKKLPVLDIAPRSRIGFNLSALTFVVSYYLYLLKEKLRGIRGVIYTIDLDQFSFTPIPLLGMPYFFETHASKRGIRYARFLRDASGIITINKLIKKDLVNKFKLDPKRITVHPNGMDLQMFNEHYQKEISRKEIGIKRNIPTVVYLGKFYPWKGLEIIKAVAKKLPDITFYCVGGTEEEFKRVTKETNTTHNMKFTGHRPQREIPHWLSAADLLLVLGTKKNEYSYYQTSPMKLFEYMAMKRPILASDTPANRQIIGEGEALFYKPDNETDMSDKIHDAIREPSKLVSRIENAYEKAQTLSWEKRAKSIFDAITAQT